jgi:hypothetical protein
LAIETPMLPANAVLDIKAVMAAAKINFFISITPP